MLTELLDLLLPPRCAGCGGPEACCPSCLAQFGRPTRVHLPGRPTYALADYQGAPRELVIAFKERGRHDLAASLGTLLGHAVRAIPEIAPPGTLTGHAVRTNLQAAPPGTLLGHAVRADPEVAPPGTGQAVRATPETAPPGTHLSQADQPIPEADPDPPGTLWLVPAPSRRSASRRRGGPHVLRLARAAARTLSTDTPVAVAPALTLAPGALDSTGLTAKARRANLAGRVRPTEALPPPGTRVVLLDDVVTTGATAAECARVLRSHGVHVAAVLALTSAAGHRWWSPPG